MEIGTQLILAAVDRAAMLAVFAEVIVSNAVSSRRTQARCRRIDKPSSRTLGASRSWDRGNHRMGPPFEWRQVRCGVDQATL